MQKVRCPNCRHDFEIMHRPPSGARPLLTPKMRDTLEFITNYAAEHRGVAPSYSEIATHARIKSRSGVVRLVQCLEDRGYIHRTPYKARALTVLQ